MLLRQLISFVLNKIINSDNVIKFDVCGYGNLQRSSSSRNLVLPLWTFRHKTQQLHSCQQADRTHQTLILNNVLCFSTHPKSTHLFISELNFRNIYFKTWSLFLFSLESFLFSVKLRATTFCFVSYMCHSIYIIHREHYIDKTNRQAD